ncbi:aldo/keto reductase [Nonomuraea dietziae]
MSTPLTPSLEASLRRLGTDYLDLYWVYLWDRHTSIEETMRVLDDAVRAGKILYVGMSGPGLRHRPRQHATGPRWRPFKRPAFPGVWEVSYHARLYISGPRDAERHHGAVQRGSCGGCRRRRGRRRRARPNTC